MAKPKRDGYTRRNITFSDELHDQVLKVLPYEGARDFSSFVELASRRLVDEAKASRKPAGKRNPAQ